jgi:hypothetical protein
VAGQSVSRHELLRFWDDLKRNDGELTVDILPLAINQRNHPLVFEGNLAALTIKHSQ